MGAIAVERLDLGDARLREFERLPWRLYRGDPNWTPQLKMDLLGSRLLKVNGLLTADHPYQEQADVTHFIVRRDGQVVGRVSAAVNHRFNEYHDCKIGSFGFFETENDFEVASALLDAARDWVADRGMEILRGPGEYSNATYERQALLVDGFDTSPVVELTHNPPYYQDLIERYGFGKVMDYHAYRLDIDATESLRVRRVAAAVRARREIETRAASVKDFAEDVRLVARIYNEAWAENWGFLPLTMGEADVLADTLKPILDPELVRFAYVGGEPAAVLGAFPDPNWALRPRWKWYGDSDAVRIARLLAVRRHIPRVRLMFFGIRPRFRRLGIDAVLFEEVLDHALSKGYKECDISMLLEHNDLILRASEFMGARRYKTWRIYDLPLTGSSP